MEKMHGILQLCKSQKKIIMKYRLGEKWSFTQRLGKIHHKRDFNVYSEKQKSLFS